MEDESPTLSNNKLVLQAIIENFIFHIFAILILSKSSHPEVFCKRGVLRNFAKFTGKHLCQSLFNFIKKEALAKVLSCEFYEITKNTFFHTSGGWFCLSRLPVFVFWSSPHCDGNCYADKQRKTQQKLKNRLAGNAP